MIKSCLPSRHLLKKKWTPTPFSFLAIVCATGSFVPYEAETRRSTYFGVDERHRIQRDNDTDCAQAARRARTAHSIPAAPQTRVTLLLHYLSQRASSLLHAMLLPVHVADAEELFKERNIFGPKGLSGR